MSGSWATGDIGPNSLVRCGQATLRDFRRVQRGWHWNQPRPHDWPESSSAVPDAPDDLGWARNEPVRTIRLLMHQVLRPYTEVMTHPQVSGQGWLTNLDRSVIIASNHSSHADTSLLLHALPDRARERTVVAAAADYWYRRPMLGRLVSVWLNTFPFSRTGGATEVLHRSSELLKGGWHLLVYPEGSRTSDGRIQPFKPGVGHLATQTRTPVVPVHVRGSRRVMPRGQAFPVPAPVSIRIGKPLVPGRDEGSREFTARVEAAVRDLAQGGEGATGGWIERWRASASRGASGLPSWSSPGATSGPPR